MLAYAAGEAAAFAVLYGRWRRPIYRYIDHQCGRDGKTDELFQEVWLRVVNARKDYQPSARFSTWLYRIAHNRVVDHWRAQNIRKSIESDSFMPMDFDGDVMDAFAGPRTSQPDQSYERSVLAGHIVAALTALPEEQREAFLLAEGGMSLEDIAATVGVGRETIKSRLRYAMSKLRKELDRWKN